MKRLRQLKSESGLALVMTIGITTVLAISGTAITYYSTADATQAYQSRASQNVAALAEAGLNDAFSVLNQPTNNALDPDTLPKCTTNDKQYTDPAAVRTSTATWLHGAADGGTFDYCATLVRSEALWYVTSIGSAKNPTRASAKVTKTLAATVTVTPTFTQPLNNPSWNYMFATHTGSTCDETLSNNVNGGSRMYILGNLCLSNNVGLSPTSLVVKGNLTLNNNAFVGASTSMSTRVETYVGGSCTYTKGGTANPCTGNQDSNNIFSKQTPPNYVVGVNHNPVLLSAPNVDLNTWYENAIPGPSQGCTTSSGTVPVFDDNYPTRDNSVASAFNLTPASSYTCIVGPAGNPSGEIAWNSSTSTLTVTGTMFIDGSAKITSGLAQYNGQATLYLSGTLSVSGKLCGGISGGNCDSASWNPNTEMFTIVTNSTGGQVTAGDGVQFSNGAGFQGALYSTGNIDMGNNAWSDGPMVAPQIILSNNVTTSSFGAVTTVPVGQPGNPAVYAQPNPPQSFSG